VDRLIYVAMNGAKQLMQAQSLVANNLANAGTNGFRADLARFSAMPVQGPGYATRVNSVARGLGFDTTPGTLVDTGNPLDVAIEGSGWIAVQAPDGTEALTRDGALRINALGLLETRRGDLVLGDNGPIAIPPHVELVIGRDGTISIVPQGQGAETLAQVGRIKLVDPDPATLEKRPDGRVQVAGGEPADADGRVRLVSGFIESSNVNGAEMLVGMIELARQFEIEVRMMRVADENASRAADLIRMA